MAPDIISKIAALFGLDNQQASLRARNLHRPDKDGIYRIKKGNVEFIAHTRVLIDVAADLADCIPDDWDKPVVIVVGSDRMAPVDEDRPIIGIQTEHFADENSQRLWFDLSESRIEQMVDGFSKILDLSVHSAPFYQHLDQKQRAKLTFGPYIFPYAPVQFVEGDKPPAFFGWVKDRRKEFINDLSRKIDLEVVPKRTHGRRLQRKISTARAILNVHYHPGVYAEAPRLLKAYLAGKPVMTEELGHPFIMGRHVLPVDTVPSDEQAKSVFGAFSDEIAMKHKFVDFLNDALKAI